MHDLSNRGDSIASQCILDFLQDDDAQAFLMMIELRQRQKIKD
jgi:hypothetical protein